MLLKGKMPRESDGWEGIRIGELTSGQFALRRGAGLLAEGEHSALHSCGLETLRVSGRKTRRGRPNANSLQSPPAGPGRGAQGAGP